jgi:prepilin-type N-terminal cleavage/methylation domain-containing protein
MTRHLASGFTLMELLAVIAFLSITAGLGKIVGKQWADRRIQSGCFIRSAATNVVTTTNIVYTLRLERKPAPEAVYEYQ